MSSWLAYTVGPADGEDAAELRDALADGVPDAVVEHARQDDPKFVTPFHREKFGVLSTLSFTSWDADQDALWDAILDWLAEYSRQIDVVYLVEANNTSDTARIGVYRPGDGSLRKVESEEGVIRRHRERIDEDDFFPESGMMVVPEDEYRGYDHSPGEMTNWLDVFEERYGHRPMLHYNGETEVW